MSDLNDEQRRFLRERAQMRAAMVAELEALRGDSVDAVAIEPAELRTRLEDIMQRYLGDADTPEMRASREQLYSQYATLTDATARLRFLEDIGKQFGVDE